MPNFSIALVAAQLVTSSLAMGEQAGPKPPKRADVPFRVFVTVELEDEAEAQDDVERKELGEARDELAKRVRKNDKWFRLAESEADAEIIVSLVNYWTRQERRVLTTWGVVPPTEAGQPDQTQMIEIITYHYLEARVEVFGVVKTLRGERVRNDRGNAKDAVKDLEERLQELVRDEYYELEEQRSSQF